MKNIVLIMWYFLGPILLTGQDWPELNRFREDNERRASEDRRKQNVPVEDDRRLVKNRRKV